MVLLNYQTVSELEFVYDSVKSQWLNMNKNFKINCVTFAIGNSSFRSKVKPRQETDSAVTCWLSRSVAPILELGVSGMVDCRTNNKLLNLIPTVPLVVNLYASYRSSCTTINPTGRSDMGWAGMGFIPLPVLRSHRLKTRVQNRLSTYEKL